MKDNCHYEPYSLNPSPSLNVVKTNTLHQFDSAKIIGIQSPVGKIPIVFYVRHSCNSASKGIVYFGDRDSVCYMFPEDAHAEWCCQPYDMKYDGMESYDNGIESGMKRNHGIFELWVSVLRKWYNGRVLFRPTVQLRGCPAQYHYPQTKKETTQPVRVSHTTQPTQHKSRTGCGCNK